MSKKNEVPELRQRKAELKKMLQRVNPPGIPGERYGTNDKVRALLEELGLARLLDTSSALPSDAEFAELLAQSIKERQPPATKPIAASAVSVISSSETDSAPTVESRPTVTMVSKETVIVVSTGQLEETSPEPPVKAVVAATAGAREESIPVEVKRLTPAEEQAELDRAYGGDDFTTELEDDGDNLTAEELELDPTSSDAFDVGLLEDPLKPSGGSTPSPSPPLGGRSNPAGGKPGRQRPPPGRSAPSTPPLTPTPPAPPIIPPTAGPTTSPGDKNPEKKKPKKEKKKPMPKKLPNWAWLSIGAAAAVVLMVATVLLTVYATGKRGEVVLSKSEHDKLKSDLASEKDRADEAETELADAKTERETAKEQVEQAAFDKNEAERQATLDRKQAETLSHERADFQRQLEEQNALREAERLERFSGRSMRDIQAADALVIAKRLGLSSTDVKASSATVLEYVRRGLEQNQKIDDLKKEIEKLKTTPTPSPTATSTPPVVPSTTGGLPPPSPPSPEATISGPDSTKVNHEVTFEAKNLKGNIQKFTWRMGDGTELIGNLVKYKYVTLSTFTVTLTIEDDKGNTFESQKQIQVEK